MYQATCADCGDTCSVPFRPKGDRPIYCKACFGKHAGRDAQPHAPSERQLFRATCDSCGNPCEVPFRPTGEKPVYCKACFGTKGGRTRGAMPVAQETPQLSNQLRTLNEKLDAILALLSKPAHQAPKKVAEEKRVVKRKSVKKKRKSA